MSFIGRSPPRPSGGGGVALCNSNPTSVGANNVAAPGTDADASRCDHVHAVDTDSPVDLQVGDANSPGVLNSLARSDHTHGIPVGAPDDLVCGAAGVIGVVGDFARSDHVHGVPAGPAVTTGTANAAGASGDFSRADHVHETLVTNAAPAAAAPDNVAAAGVSGEPARADHVHAVPTANVGSTGTANGSGSDNTLARSDHVHRTQVQVKKNGAVVGNRPKINFIEGSNVTITTVDDGGNDEVDVTIASTGAGGGGNFAQIVSTGSVGIGSGSWTAVSGTSVLVPAAGDYIITCNFDCRPDFGSDFRVRLVNNGVQITGTERAVQCNTTLEFPASITIRVASLALNDDIELEVIRDSGFGSCSFHDRINFVREQ